MKYSKKAFTLVELIIVVVILAILATVWFISYEDYLTDTRDSKRLSQISWLRDAIRLSITKGALPLPDDAVKIRNNGTEFMYQWYAGEDVLSSVAYSDNTVDPFDDVYYTYLLSRNRKDFQLMGFLEKYNADVISATFPQVWAVDYSQRFPKTYGKKLWILLEQNTNTPIQEMTEYTSSGYMDLADATSNMFDAYVTDTYLISGKEEALVWIIPFTTCKKILENGDSHGNGIYNINPSGLNPFEVYCNMEIDNGGWTLVGRSIAGAAGGDFWWLVSNGSIRDDSGLYSLGTEVLNLSFNEIMVTDYTTWKNISRAIKVWIDRGFIQDPANHLSIVNTNTCSEIYPLSPSWRSPCDGDGEDGKDGTRNMVRKWWFFEKRAVDGGGYTNDRFHFRNSWNESANYPNSGLSRDGFHGDGDGTMQAATWEFDGKQWMIFVR